MISKLSEKNLFGVRVTTSSEKDILEYVLSTLTNSDKKLSIFTPNPEIIVKAHSNPKYKAILNSGSIMLPDGAGLILASWVLGAPLEHRITGVDFLVNLSQRVAQYADKKSLCVGFVGAKAGVALRTAECLQSAFPELRISFIGEEWPASQRDEEDGVFIPEKYQLKIAESHFGNIHALKKAITEQTSGNSTDMKYESGGKSHGENKSTRASSLMNHDSKIDVLFVAFGAPKQEEWIASHLDNLPVRVAIGVGGAFDFISGQVSRAPYVIRFLGLEWLYRLIRQPWRWKRQLSLLTFLKLTAEEWVDLVRQAFRKNP